MACNCCHKENECPDWYFYTDFLLSFVTYTFNTGVEIFLVFTDRNSSVSCDYSWSWRLPIPSSPPPPLPATWQIDDFAYPYHPSCFWGAARVTGTFVIQTDETAVLTLFIDVPCCLNEDPIYFGTLKIGPIVLQSTYTYYIQESDVICV